MSLPLSWKQARLFLGIARRSTRAADTAIRTSQHGAGAATGLRYSAKLGRGSIIFRTIETSTAKAHGRFVPTGCKACQSRHFVRLSVKPPVRASTDLLAPLLLAVVATIGFFTVKWISTGPSGLFSSAESAMPSEAPETVAAVLPPGRPGNLTPEQEEKLRHLWRLVLQICGVDLGLQLEKAPTLDRRQTSGSAKSEKQKKKRTSLFSRKSKGGVDAKESKDSAAATPAASTNVAGLSIKELSEDSDDKYGQTKQFHEALASESPEVIRDTIWSMVKHDHPDALLLRFLRARKWDVGKALVMLVSTMKWRAEEMHVEDDIMKNGEGGAALQEQSTDAATKKKGQDFLAQIRMGKSFVHGIDSAGRPICIVRVRLHHQGEQTEESLERYTVYVIETARLLLKPPVDTAVRLPTQTHFPSGILHNI
jgi:hypothetical protein